MPRAIESVKPDDGGRYIDGDERDGYVDRPMKLQGVNFESKARFGPRWLVKAVMLDTAELVKISLADNPTRTTMFQQVREDIEADGADAYEPVVLYREAPKGGGNSFWTFRTATSDELEAAAEAEAIEAEPTGSDDPGELDEAATAAAKGKGHK